MRPLLALLLLLPTAARADRAARVLFAEGQATVRSGAASRPAAPNLVLSREDELAVPPGGLVLLQLPNGYLVRVDDDLTLKVGELALLDAPRTSESRDSQLARLLSADEHKRYGERLMGARASLAAADAQAAQPAPGSAPPPPPSVQPMAPAPASGAAARTAARAPAPAAESKEEVADQADVNGLGLQGTGQGGGGTGEGTIGLGQIGTIGHGAGAGAPVYPAAESKAAQSAHAKKGRVAGKADAAPPAWWLRGPADAQPRLQTGAPPAELLVLARRPGVRACMERAMLVLGPSGRWPKVMLQIRQGKLVKLRLEGGLDASACPQPLGESAGKLPEGWAVIEVPR